MTDRSATKAAFSIIATSTSGRGPISSRIRRSGSARPRRAEQARSARTALSGDLPHRLRAARAHLRIAIAGWREAGRGQDVPIDRLAYAALVYVGETEKEAHEGAEKLLWYVTANKVAPHFANPPGYVPVAGQRGRCCAGRRIDQQRRSQGERDRRDGDRGRPHVRRHARPGLSADQAASRLCRRLSAIS